MDVIFNWPYVFIKSQTRILAISEKTVGIRTSNIFLLDYFCKISIFSVLVKDKAEVLVQMEKAQNVKDELAEEVERLHALLEQERSKVRALTSDNKNKGKVR